MKVLITSLIISGLVPLAAGCNTAADAAKEAIKKEDPKPAVDPTTSCTDPDLAKIATDVSIKLCDGTTKTGTLDLSNLLPENIKSGVVVAGVTGTLSAEAATADCSADGETGCVTTASFPAADATIALASNIKSGIVLAGVTGSLTSGAPANCSSDGQISCVANSSYKAANASALLAANIKNGITIGGVSGNVIAESHSDCTTDGTTGCVTTSSFKSANMTNATAANIKSSIVIAGVTGTAALESHSDCSSDGATGCVTTASYKAADMSVAIAGNIKSSATIAGVAGSVTAESHSNCSSDGATGCITTAGFPAADSTNLVAANIKRNVTIGGVTGSKRDIKICRNVANTGAIDTSSVNNLPVTAAAASWVASTDTVTFTTKHGLVTGDAVKFNKGSIAPTGLTDNTTYYAIVTSTTALKLATSLANANAGTAVDITGSGSGTHKLSPVANSTRDYFDTIDDYANALYTGTSPWSSSYVCDASNFTDVSGGTNLVPTNTTPTSGDTSWSKIYQDQLTGMYFTNLLNSAGTATWAEAYKSCASLNSGDGAGAWRLPTQKELLQLYIDGIAQKTDIPGATGGLGFFTVTTSTQYSDPLTPGNVWVSYVYGYDFYQVKTTATSFLCVK